MQIYNIAIYYVARQFNFSLITGLYEINSYLTK
jgi:hypothetical protein